MKQTIAGADTSIILEGSPTGKIKCFSIQIRNNAASFFNNDRTSCLVPDLFPVILLRKIGFLHWPFLLKPNQLRPG